MTKSSWVFEAHKNSQGHYECQPMRQTSYDQRFADADYSDVDDSNTSAGTAEKAFYIDPNVANAVSPDWVVQAQEIFMQSLRSNSDGGHAEYLKQMRAQFELMHQTLQQQMAQFSQKS